MGVLFDYVNMEFVGAPSSITISGLTASAAEINTNTSVVAGTASASKTAVLGASKNLDILGLPVGGLKIGPAGTETVVTPTAIELNSLSLVPITLTTVSTTPASGSCACQFAFKNGTGGALGHSVSGFAYSSGVDGLSQVAVTSFATLTNGVVLPVSTTKLFQFVTSATGTIGCTLTASAGTYYITFINTNTGSLLTSSAIVVNA